MKGNIVYAVFEKKTVKKESTTRIVALGLNEQEANDLCKSLSRGGSGNEYFVGCTKLGG